MGREIFIHVLLSTAVVVAVICGGASLLQKLPVQHAVQFTTDTPRTATCWHPPAEGHPVMLLQPSSQAVALSPSSTKGHNGTNSNNTDIRLSALNMAIPPC